MNVQDYRTEGYNLSTLLDQSLVNRAESEVYTAYILPLVGDDLTTEEREEEPYRSAIMALSFLLLQLRTISGTRAGGKAKQTDKSTSPTHYDILLQNAHTCDMKLQAIADNPQDSVNDICGIYFRSNYFYTN